MEAILNGITTIRRVSTAALAAAVLITGLETLPTAPATPTATAGSTTSTINELLDLRAKPAAAARATSAKRVAAPVVTKKQTRLSAAQRRARANNLRRAAIVRFARAQAGKWYQMGATGPRRFDCSGLTKAAYRKARINLPRTSREQRRVGQRVSSKNARPGDLVSFNGHVGVLTGKWTMTDAPGSGRRILTRRIYRDSSLQFRQLIPRS